MSEAGSENGTRGGTAVVTGGASGLGAIFSEHLARLGFDVAVCDLSSPEATVAAVQEQGRRAYGCVADVSDPADVERFAAGVRAELGPVGVLVNNVGISPRGDFEQLEIEEWRRVMAINLDSLFLVSRAFIGEMKERRWGRIVNMTSGLGWDAEARQAVAYGTSKLGVLGFTRTLASEVGEHGITVNAICPGLIRTPTLVERFPAERWESVRERQAVKRIAEPEDLLAALSLLVSEEAAMITAVNLPVNGGRLWI